MNQSMTLRICGLLLASLLTAACTTGGSNQVLTVNPAGNYTANVNPYGGSGR